MVQRRAGHCNCLYFMYIYKQTPLFVESCSANCITVDSPFGSVLHMCLCLPAVDIASIREVRGGRSTEVMQQAVPDVPEDCCFTIIHGPRYAHLNLVATEPQQRNAWMHALEALSKINSECVSVCVSLCN